MLIVTAYETSYTVTGDMPINITMNAPYQKLSTVKIKKTE